MLYVTTRTKDDVFTSNRALSESRGPDGGFFVPMRLQAMDANTLEELSKKTFSSNVAEIVNYLFNTKLDGWGIEFAIGRYPVKIVRVGSRTLVAETWHNPMWKFERLARGVEKAIRQSDQISRIPTDWLMIGARIAVLFGVFGDLLRDGCPEKDGVVDIAVPCGNFSAPMAAWYARKMGLPIGNIIVCCNENSGAWNLLHKGEIRTDAAEAATETPLCDYAVPPDLERLISASLGSEAALRFSQICRKGGSFYLEPEEQELLRRGIYASVVSQKRMENTLCNRFSTHGYICDPYTALCFSGVSDYRAATGEGRQVLILSEYAPVHFLEQIARYMGISEKELKEKLDQQ